MAKIIGMIEQCVIDLLGLGRVPCPILWGESNRGHIEIHHAVTYKKYETSLESTITEIIKTPNYVGFRNGSIEYVKNMPDGEILKVAVKASKQGTYFARTMYPIQQEELKNFLLKKTLVKMS